MSTTPTPTTNVIYKCDTCKRVTQLVLDGRRPDPSHCNITRRCHGRLVRQGERQTKEFLFTPPVVGLEDYVPRGTIIKTKTLTPTVNPIILSTTDEVGVIVLAALKSRLNSANGTLRDFYITDQLGNDVLIETLDSSVSMPNQATISAMLYEVIADPVSSKSFSYVKPSSVPFVSGPDDSLLHPSLRFTSDNLVTVYVNGVLWPRYVVGGPNLAPYFIAGTITDPVTSLTLGTPDTITFQPLITTTNNVVEVIVYNPIANATSTASTNLIKLDFKSLRTDHPTELAQRQVNAWGDCAGAIVNDESKYLLYCTDMTKLLPTKHYTVAWFQAMQAPGNGITPNGNVFTLDPNHVCVLLGKEPLQFIDKELYALVHGVELLNNAENALSYSEFYRGGERELTVPQAIITQVYNPIRPFNLLTEVAQRLDHDEESESNQADLYLGAESLTRSYVLGPR